MSGMSFYWLLKLDCIRDLLYGFATVFTILIVLSGIATIIAFAAIVDGCPAQSVVKATRPIFIACLVIAPLLWIAETLIPSTKQMAAIIVVPKLVEVTERSETMQKIPGKLLSLADEWINELSPKNVKGAEE
jgi:fucose 4-O-acetylase-like acetyltransferase